jgi:hypothetical protein
MTGCDWIESFAGAVTVCDLSGIVLEMNQRSAEMYRSYGGKALIGRNLLECHPEPARKKLLHLLESGERNIYSIEKNGIKKLIYQTPWIVDGRRCGIMELALEIPADMPNYIRK